MEIKFGSPYTVQNGYMIYENGADYDSGKVQKMGKGAPITMNFEAAAALAAGASLLLSMAF